MSIEQIDKIVIFALFLITWICIWGNNIEPKEREQ